MKKYASVISLLLVGFAIYWGFQTSMPIYESDATVSDTLFSTDRALEHVKAISQKPHAVGFPAHQEVRGYIVSELQKMGLETEIQEGYSLSGRANLSRARNILAKIKGSETGSTDLELSRPENDKMEDPAGIRRPKGKALLLLSHYDSSPHSSLGASDAGSGVATILEGVRAFLASGRRPKNDIIILFTDAEELGLNGARLFVNRHPWAREVGLVLNFEARGSGGPSYAFIETNRGNQNLLKEFVRANPKYPMANSLYYSIYKLLPNDTDLTVFREDRDIDGFNFAFIDDHFDYHTAQDSYERLDRNTLAHQGSYLMPLLEHFSNADLGGLKSLNDQVYFNIPFFGMVFYPFDWIWPLFWVAIIAFLVFLVLGIRKKSLKIRGILVGFAPMLITLATNGIVGYYAWPLLKKAYPQYQDILHGFPYNGHTYIAAFVLLSLAVCFGGYYRFRKVPVADLLVGPLVLWLTLCALLSIYLQGAAFFIVPVLAFLASWYITLHQKKPHSYLMVVLALPALWLFSPFIQGFVVGLGLKMLVAATLLTTLSFFLLLPIFGYYKNKKSLAYLGLLLFFGCFLAAHFDSGFDETQAKPSSLVYLLDEDAKTAQWGTYDRVLTEWNASFFRNDGMDAEGKKMTSSEKDAASDASAVLSSKYGLDFHQKNKAPLKNIKGPKIEKLLDTVLADQRQLKLRIVPQRNANRLEVFTDGTEVLEASVNGLPISPYFLNGRKNKRLLTHYISENDSTEISLSIEKNGPLKIICYEASNDLLSHPLFEVAERPREEIPMPFVLNDAVVTIRTLQY